MFAVPKAQPVMRRQKLRDLNECITCRLCHGYLIEPTTINECMHSFCKSCIVLHLLSSTQCPLCPDMHKNIRFTHLRPDPHLKALVFKLVPTLCQSEILHLRAYNETHGNKPTGAATVKSDTRRIDLDDGDNSTDVQAIGDSLLKELEDDVNSYFAPDDPISLSLEYHPVAVEEYDSDRIPTPKYLQCPAAVTVHHLQRFLATKFSLNFAPSTSSIDIQIILDDEVLPAHMSLMDIAYCSKWKRLKPLQVFYQILITSNQTPVTPAPTATPTTNAADCPNALPTNQPTESKSRKKSKRSRSHTSPSVNNNYPSDAISINQYSISTDKPTKPTKVTLVKNHGNGFASADANKSKSKVTQSNGDGHSDDSESSPNAKKLRTTSDFKSLRSNVIKYTSEVIALPRTNAEVPSKAATNTATTSAARPAADTRMTTTPRAGDNESTSAAASDTASGCGTPTTNDIFSSMKREYDVEQKHILNGRTPNVTPAAIPEEPPVLKPNVVVCIPPRTRRNSISLEHAKCMSVARMKTANKKVRTSSYLKKSISMDDSVTLNRNGVKPDIPKLKIELATLTRIVVPPPSEPVVEPPTDIREYVKNIGLQPIEKPVEINPFEFPAKESTEKHKKRKKSNKHSKEPGNKRRKLHAEISSQEEESLKLKLKITANKPSKSERKVSFSTTSSDDGSKSPQERTMPVLTRREPLSEPEPEPSPTQSIVNYSEFMSAKEPDVTITKVPIAVSPPKRQMPPRRQSVSFIRTPPTFAPRTWFANQPTNKSVVTPEVPIATITAISSPKPPISPSSVAKNQSSNLNRSSSIEQLCEAPSKLNKPEPVPKSKPSVPDLIPTTSIKSAPPPMNRIESNGRVNGPTIRSSIELELAVRTLTSPTPMDTTCRTNLHPTSPVLQSYLEARPNMEIVPLAECQRPQPLPTTLTQPTQPKVTRPMPATIPLSKIRAINFNGNGIHNVDKVGALDLSACKSPEPQTPPIAHTTISISPRLQSPITIIDITTPTKSSPEHRHSPSSSSESTSADNTKKLEPPATNLFPAISPPAYIPKPLTWILPRPPAATHSTIHSQLSSKKMDEFIKNELRMQNLTMLSESAQAREKLSLSYCPMPQFSTINAKPRSLNIPKVPDLHSKAGVRQQNASVRSIPNPSALAFRQQHGSPITQSPPPLVSMNTPPAVATQSMAAKLSSLTQSITVSIGSNCNYQTIPQLPPTTPVNSHALNTNGLPPTTADTSKATSTTPADPAASHVNATAQLALPTSVTDSSGTLASHQQLLQALSEATIQQASATTAAATPSASEPNNNNPIYGFKMLSSDDYQYPVSIIPIQKSSGHANDTKLIAAKTDLHIERLMATTHTSSAAAPSSAVSTGQTTAVAAVSSNGGSTACASVA